MIRDARADELALLSDLAFRSKASWGYAPAFMEACRDELTLTEGDLGRVFVGEWSGRIEGFYSLQPLSDTHIELGHLFVDPDAQRRGRGRALLQDALRRGREGALSILVVQGDPNARDFYTRCGAVQVGERPSDSIPGRLLPLFEFPLTA